MSSRQNGGGQGGQPGQPGQPGQGVQAGQGGQPGQDPQGGQGGQDSQGSHVGQPGQARWNLQQRGTFNEMNHSVIHPTNFGPEGAIEHIKRSENSGQAGQVNSRTLGGEQTTDQKEIFNRMNRDNTHLSNLRR